MLSPSEYKHLRQEHGFRRRMRRMIRGSALPWWAKAELCRALAGQGPGAAWELYKRIKNEVDNAV